MYLYCKCFCLCCAVVCLSCPAVPCVNCCRKRTCYVNAGMSDSCDYKTLVKDLNNELTWSAGETPGKRKRNNGGEAMKESHSDIGRFLRSMRVLAANHKRR